jgi:hypothetical protein
MPVHHIRPHNPFIVFKPDDIEQSITALFELKVAQYPDRLAVKSRYQALAYAALNQWAKRWCWPGRMQRVSNV